MCWWSTGVEGMHGADHRRDLRRPDPGGVDDELGVDRFAVGQDARDLATTGELEPGHARAGLDPDPQRASRVRDGVGRAMRVEVPVAGEMDGAVQRFWRDRRHQPAGLLRTDHPGVEPDAARPARGPLQLPELLGRGSEPEAADGLERTERPVELDAVAAELPSSSTMG